MEIETKFTITQTEQKNQITFQMHVMISRKMECVGGKVIANIDTPLNVKCHTILFYTSPLIIQPRGSGSQRGLRQSPGDRETCQE